jgi:hypothetical protein
MGRIGGWLTVGTALGLGGGVVAQAEINRALIKTMIRIESVRVKLVVTKSATGQHPLFPFAQGKVKDSAFNAQSNRIRK